MANDKPIIFHNTPAFYLEYTRNWLEKKRNTKGENPAELAIVEDIHKLVEIAVGVLDPVPAEQVNDKK